MFFAIKIKYLIVKLRTRSQVQVRSRTGPRSDPRTRAEDLDLGLTLNFKQILANNLTLDGA